jgi:uncharacterized membrane protein YeaQ/YmgE (transglycosylase-associated protein family)
MVVVFGWAFVGLIVAAVDKSMRRGRDSDDTMVTVLCVAGALAGGFSGQTFRWYVFGQPLGFLCSAAGAALLLTFYRSRNTAIGPGDEVAPPMPVAPPPSTPIVTSDTPLGIRFAEGLGWGLPCGFAVAVSGFLGHLVGGKLYPQRYEQIPSDFLFVPLGLIIGFVGAATARLAWPQWSARRMFGVVALLTIAYGSLMFDYSRSHAIPERLTVVLEPDPVTAVSCSPAACPQADPPLQWTVQGQLHVHETSGLGGTVNGISLYSNTTTVRYGPHQVTREEALEENKFEGPRVRLTGRDIVGAHHVGPNELVSYPIQYSYRTRDGSSRPDVSVYVEFTDAAGRPGVEGGLWKVR